MLNSNTQKILSDLTAISTTAIISHPVTGVQDIDRSIVAFINLEELGEEAFDRYGLMNITEFLSLISLVDSPEIVIENRIATITNDYTTSKYYTTDISIIEDAYGTNPAILENIDKAFEAANFDITSDQLDKLKKTSGFLKVADLVVKPEGSGLVLDITDSTKTDTNSLKTTIMGTCNDADMVIVLDMNNIKKIPSGNYNIKVAKNPKSGSYITKWTSKDLSSLQIVVSLAARD
jgi:hypothetical protein